MKLLVVGDLHGSKPVIHYGGYDAVIAPGDFCTTNKLIKYVFKALSYRLEHPKSRKEWYDLVGKREARRLIKESLSGGRRVLELLNNLGVPVYLVPGNHDFTPSLNNKWPYLRQDNYSSLKTGLRNLIDVHKRLRGIGDYQIIGYGVSSGPEFPQYAEDLASFSESELRVKKRAYKRLFNQLDKLFLKATKPVIFLTHNVPFNTKIDKIVNPDSPRNGYHFGSLIARELIDKHQPLLCIGGHMHEHHAKVKIGRTVCVNAGFGSKVNTLIKLSGDKVRVSFYDG